MKARAFSLAIHGHYLNYQKAPSTNKDKTFPSTAASPPSTHTASQETTQAQAQTGRSTTYLNLTKRGLGHNAPRGEAITQLGAT